MRRSEWHQAEVERDLRIAATITVCGIILLTAWLNYGATGSVIGAGPDEKGSSPPQQQQAEPEGIPPHPHPEEVSDGQWMFWAAIAAGAFACIAAGIKIYPAIRKRRKKG